MTHYRKISVLVEASGMYRVYTTQCFTIRPITNLLFRFTPKYRIIAVIDGQFPSHFPADNEKWRRLSKSKVAEMQSILENENVYSIDSLPETNSKSYLLENFPYRKALNLWYIYAAKNKIYPSKQPFYGVQVKAVPEWIIKEIGMCEHPTFISDENNPYISNEDILRWYDGRRYDKMVNGYMASGYMLEKIRIQTSKTDEDTTDTTDDNE